MSSEFFYLMKSTKVPHRIEFSSEFCDSHIPAIQLKSMIMMQENLPYSPKYDLLLKDAYTKKFYADNDKVEAFSVVIVSRVSKDTAIATAGTKIHMDTTTKVPTSGPSIEAKTKVYLDTTKVTTGRPNTEAKSKVCMDLTTKVPKGRPNIEAKTKAHVDIATKIPTGKPSIEASTAGTNYKVQESMSFEDLVKTGNLFSANASEEDKIRAMMIQSTAAYHPSNYKATAKPSRQNFYHPYSRTKDSQSHPQTTYQSHRMQTTTQVSRPPAGYFCHICNSSDHYIRDCPKKNDSEFSHRSKRRIHGIPKSFLTPVNNPDLPGARMTNEGTYAVQTMHAKAYIKGKKERPPFVPVPEQEKVPKRTTPSGLTCPLCKNIVKDASQVRCCRATFCDDCIRSELFESEHVCPQCHQPGQTPASVEPNVSARNAVLIYH